MNVMEAIKTRWSRSNYGCWQTGTFRQQPTEMEADCGNRPSPELRKQMVADCKNQKFVGAAPVNLVICATDMCNMLLESARTSTAPLRCLI